MLKKLNWISLLAEFLVVLVGILLAFQLNQNSQAKKEREIIKTHISAIEEESQFNLTGLNRTLEYANAVSVKLDTLIALIKRKDKLAKVNQTSFELLAYGGSYNKTIAYKTLVESGDIRFLKDFEFKSKTVNLYEYYDWVKTTEDVSVQSFNEDYYDFAKNNFDMLNYTPQSWEIYESKRFKNCLSSYKYFLDSRKVRYQGCLDVLNDYIQTLEGLAED